MFMVPRFQCFPPFAPCCCYARSLRLVRFASSVRSIRSLRPTGLCAFPCRYALDRSIRPTLLALFCRCGVFICPFLAGHN